VLSAAVIPGYFRWTRTKGKLFYCTAKNYWD